MKIFNWFKRLFDKSQDVKVDNLKEVIFDHHGNPIDKEAAYQRILSIVSHLFETMGLGKCFKIERSESCIQLTISTLSGITRIVNFSTPEELYATVYGLHLAQDIFHVKSDPPKPSWAQDALLNVPSDALNAESLQREHSLQEEIRRLEYLNNFLKHESGTNYRRRCVAETFITVLRKHIDRETARILTLCSGLEVMATSSTPIQSCPDAVSVMHAFAGDLKEVCKTLKNHKKVDLMSRQYLEERGEPAEA